MATLEVRSSAELVRKLSELYGLLYTFPREVGDPSRRVVKSLTELFEFIFSCTRSSKPCYTAVYSFRDREFREPVVDRIFLDFDAGEESLEDCWGEVREFAKFLESMKIESLIVFSGKKGFHLYIFFPEIVLKHPKEAIERFVSLLVSRFQAETKRQVKYLDRKVVGDVRRLARIPYTIHEESRRAAVIVDPSMSLEEILRESEKPTVKIPALSRSEEVSLVLRYIDEVLDVELKKFRAGEEKKEGVVYLQLPCIRTLLTTVLPPGKRRMKASKFIAIAYYFDHDGSMEGFETVAELFAERQKIGHELRRSEVLGWKRGVYQLNNGQGPVWNCAEIREYFREAFLTLKCYRCPLEKKRVEEELQKKIQEIRALRAVEKKDVLHEIKSVLDYFVVGEDENKLLLYLLLLEKQNVIIKGPPSSGKTTLVEAVLKLFPEEDVVVVSGATKKFLRWMERDYIPILYLKEAPKDILEEIKGEGLAMDVKLAMSDKELRILMVDPRERRTIEKRIRVDSVVMTTIDIDIPPDVESRAWILAPDISPEQTKKVLLYKAQLYSPAKLSVDEKVLERIRQISKALRASTRIIVPGAQYIAEAFFQYAQYPRVRRDIEKLFLLIGAIAKLRGRIYEQNGERLVIAAPEDVKTALEISQSVLRAMLTNIDVFVYTIYTALKQIQEKMPTLTAQAVAEVLDIPQLLAEEYLEKLVKSGLATRYREQSQVVYRLRSLEEKPIDIDFAKIEEEYKRVMSGLKSEKLPGSSN
jgi:energy-coupling factor transporter ATP-binding protein EcfA2